MTTVTNLPAPVRDLLATILAAVDIPHPATTADTVVYDRIRNDRISHTVAVLRNLLDDKPLMGVEWLTDYLRERLEGIPPVGYTTVDQANAALAKGYSRSQAADPDRAEHLSGGGRP